MASVFAAQACNLDPHGTYSAVACVARCFGGCRHVERQSKTVWSPTCCDAQGTSQVTRRGGNRTRLVGVVGLGPGPTDAGVPWGPSAFRVLGEQTATLAKVPNHQTASVNQPPAVCVHRLGTVSPIYLCVHSRNQNVSYAEAQTLK